MPQPTPRETHIDHLLSNISVAYMQDATNFVCRSIFPTVPVLHQSDIYAVYPRSAFWRDEVGERPLGGQAPEMGIWYSTATYLCKEEGISATIDDRERANVLPPFDPEQDKVFALTQSQLIHLDRAWAAKYFKAGVWTWDKTGIASAPAANQFIWWNDYTNSTDPVTMIDAWKESMAERTGKIPNRIVMGRKVFRYLKNHPKIISRIQYVERAIVTNELLAVLFDVDQVVIPGGIVYTGNEGQPEDMSQSHFIVGKNDMLLCYTAPSVGLRTETAGATFLWTNLIPGGGLQSVVNRGREERKHSDWFEVRMAYSLEQMAPDLGIMVTSAVDPSAA